MANADVSESWTGDARFDDFVSGQTMVLHDLRELCAAHDVDEVAALIAEADQHTQVVASVAMRVT